MSENAIFVADESGCTPRARRGGELFDYLLDRFAVHSGLSGVQPKVMFRGENKGLPPSIRSATHIVEFWDQDEYPELAANEFFCLTTMEAIADAMADVAPMAWTYFRIRSPEIGTRMLSACKDGIQESLGLTRTIVSTPESELT
jgi:hypothetical protein